jgi:uncharacterized protein
MKLTRDARADVNLIRSYGGGMVRIGERLIGTHCIVAADAIITDWDVPSAEALGAAHLDPIFALDPEIVLLGTGARQSFPAAAVREAFAARGIGLETMDLGAACRTYNILVQEERRVVALLFVS